MSPDYQKCPVVGVLTLEPKHEMTYETPDGQFRIVEDAHRAWLRERLYSRVSGFLWVDVATELTAAKACARRLNVILYPPGSEPSPEYAGLGSHPRTYHDPEPDERERFQNEN